MKATKPTSVAGLLLTDPAVQEMLYHLARHRGASESASPEDGPGVALADRVAQYVDQDRPEGKLPFAPRLHLPAEGRLVRDPQQASLKIEVVLASALAWSVWRDVKAKRAAAER